MITASVSLPRVRYRTEEAVVQFFDRVLTNVGSISGVSEAGMVSVVPMSGDFDRTGFQIAGKQFDPGEQTNPDRYIVSPGCFRALHIPLRQGRTFDQGDDADHPAVCVISETAARLWFPGESPLGKKVRAGSASGQFDGSPYRQVVGVVGDIAQYGLGLPAKPQIYMPHRQFARPSLTLMVRTDGDPYTLAGAVRKAVFAVSALSLAAIGIYGVISYGVAQRTSEFGIRMALGARPVDILRNAMWDAARMIAAGLAAGIAASFAASRLIAGFLFGVSATDATAFALLPLFLAFVAVAACYVPARRAARVDPVTALRFE